MAYKHIEIISGYNLPGRGTFFMTPDRTVKAGDIVEINNKTWHVRSVEVSDVAPHATLAVSPFSESEAKQATAREAKNTLEAIFQQSAELPVLSDPQAINPAADIVLSNPITTPIVGLIGSAGQPQKQRSRNPLTDDDQRMKLIKVLADLDSQMKIVRDWTLHRLNEFDLGAEPSAVAVLVVSMPRDGMEIYLQQLEQFLVASIKTLEDAGKLPWANVKAVVGIGKN